MVSGVSHSHSKRGQVFAQVPVSVLPVLAPGLTLLRRVELLEEDPHGREREGVPRRCPVVLLGPELHGVAEVVGLGRVEGSHVVSDQQGLTPVLLCYYTVPQVLGYGVRVIHRDEDPVVQFPLLHDVLESLAEQTERRFSSELSDWSNGLIYLLTEELIPVERQLVAAPAPGPVDGDHSLLLAGEDQAVHGHRVAQVVGLGLLVYPVLEAGVILVSALVSAYIWVHRPAEVSLSIQPFLIGPVIARYWSGVSEGVSGGGVIVEYEGKQCATQAGE